MKKLLLLLFLLIILGCSSTKPTHDFEYRYRMYQIIRLYQIQTFGMSYDTTSHNVTIQEPHQEEN
jgi:hypothetical protein